MTHAEEGRSPADGGGAGGTRSQITFRDISWAFTCAQILAERVWRLLLTPQRPSNDGSGALSGFFRLIVASTQIYFVLLHHFCAQTPDAMARPSIGKGAVELDFLHGPMVTYRKDGVAAPRRDCIVYYAGAWTFPEYRRWGGLAFGFWPILSFLWGGTLWEAMRPCGCCTSQPFCAVLLFLYGQNASLHDARASQLAEQATLT
ncbi:hypothetical protein BIW11_05050 [Tropilaelaps mercedesae]|uniref:Uncharacterized protein n=1 Tax=Tropilaelaps mercedesae TaxID=418985 RepID=A0A1V9WXX9_9ACAR|nr:hypothetical protein BIW11_05050 [Tropilaelaps mercedesae]